MVAHAPILAADSTAARLLDLSLTDFLRLVSEGLLPPGREIAPGVTRWDVETLRRIASGQAADEGIDW